jgi:molybdopterin-guanine dinucleotide biosynthesis protein A
MGVDKAVLDIDGTPMAVRVADALWEAGCHPVWCQGGDAEALTAFGLEVHPDRRPGGGPVAAIDEALTHAAGADIVVSACDLVDIDADAVRAGIGEARAGDGAVVTVANAEGRRHLLSYWPATVSAPLADLLARGRASYLDVLDALDARDVGVGASTVRNVNSPDDLRQRR